MKKISVNNFPNNKYHKYSNHIPIKFYTYENCSNKLLTEVQIKSI